MEQQYEIDDESLYTHFRRELVQSYAVGRALKRNHHGLAGIIGHFGLRISEVAVDVPEEPFRNRQVQGDAVLVGEGGVTSEAFVGSNGAQLVTDIEKDRNDLIKTRGDQ